MEKSLPTYVPQLGLTRSQSRQKYARSWRLLLLSALLVVVVLFQLLFQLNFLGEKHSKIPLHASEILNQCNLLNVKPGPPPDFNTRTQSDRFVPGTKPTLIKNATIWTGRVEGLEIVKGDILLDHGIIKGVGTIEGHVLAGFDNLVILDANEAWVSPGIVDMHSHLAVDSSPALRGANDGNSHKGPILPWLRALDGFNTHDDAYKLSISGGITTALVLPGSANAIGGQGVVIKLRRTAERSPTSMLLENPYSTNETEYNPSVSLRWRQMKHACGENPDRVYSNTRMDTTWAFRQGYDKARQIKTEQDAYCQKALAGQWEGLAPEFPEDLQWEALVDVLRGRVKVHNHCYETVDLDDMVRITNEFKFSIAAFHHAHETYLVPDTLKAAYGHPPASALFATNARYKRESYRGSEFAPKILADNGLQVVMKSDHPVLNSRHLLYEAQQAHYYGLDGNLALLAVTGTPAQVIGQDHRVGFIKSGYDADIVLWDSHPLALGATPQQVWIDGIAQISSPHVVPKPKSLQRAPETPDFDKEASEVLEYDGLPPLTPKESIDSQLVLTNVSGVFTRTIDDIQEVFRAQSEPGVVVIEGGHIVCYGATRSCGHHLSLSPPRSIDLEGGWISPSLLSFGSPLGLEEIMGDASTSDNWVPDPLIHDAPEVAGGSSALIHASDGLQYATRNALIAYKSGVTVGVTAPKSAGLVSGLSAVFSTGAQGDGLIQDVAALHVNIKHSDSLPSVSTQIAALRNLLHGSASGELGSYFQKVRDGNLPLIVNVHNADIMIALLRLKKEIEEESTTTLKIVFSGATEAHLLANAIADADVGVIVSPSRPYPNVWENRRILPGPPTTAQGAIALLLSHNITVAIGIPQAWEARNTRFDAAWAALEAGGSISKKDALALVSTNLEKLLGVSQDKLVPDLVVTKGGDLFGYESKVVAVISGARGVVDLV